VSQDFGDELGRRIRAEHRPVLRARTLRHTEAVVAEVRSEHPTYEQSEPLTPEDGFVAAVQLRDFPVHEWWEDGRRAPLSSLQAGQATLYDLQRDPRFLFNNPFHSIHFHLPRRLFDAISDESDAGRVGGLDYAPGVGIDEPVLRHLALALRPAFARPAEASPLFIEHVTVAVAVHVARTYGHLPKGRGRAVGGLSPWQMRLVGDLIDARLDGDITIGQLARQCGLSRSYFTQAFRRTTGITPHRWLMQRRTDKAKELLRNLETPLAEIALACGFASQSHLTRVFNAIAGATPGQWRRRHAGRVGP
jgi:AraC-like DNA-binding protein